MNQPQPPAPQPAPPERLTQELKLLAACAYLTWIVGFWIIGPVAIYLLYRHKSRYVAFHAIQAIVVSAGLTVLAPIMWIAGMFAVFAIGLASGKGPMPAIIMFGLYGVMIIVVFIPMLWMMLGAYRAFLGQSWRVPLAWRLAERFTQNDGQSPNQPGPFDNIYPGANR